MHHLALVYLYCVVAGFALANVPTSAVITPAVADFLGLVGGIAMVVFSAALLVLGVKALLKQ
ncbi:hypothetical protein [Virgibacillus oceani]|uniref:Uncharacterized protein n=1 Tax=Virgibacillus oceani TaxID=1479511 RepID=A0A917M5Q8_9BACI|nr:hypothetical protein [Virgibacillus oceani]GGG80716.1 hypothetical protein GCM10011398_27660 [Virgibacillus oceani]